MLRVAAVATLAMVFLCASCSNQAGSGHLAASATTPTTQDPSPSGDISIFPNGDALRVGGQRQFSGWDPSIGQYDVTWNLQEGTEAGNITENGLYTAPSTAGTFHLIATSIANPSLSGTATLTVLPIGFVLGNDMAIARSGHTATLLLDGRVLLAGGTTEATHSAELFDVGSSSFTAPNGGMVHVRTGHCASLLPDGKVLIVGGDDGNGTFFRTAELFDPVTEKFSPTGDLNQARTHATATLLQNGQVLIAGGQDRGGSRLSSAELYDPSTGVFMNTGNMDSARAQHTATLLSNGNVLFVGGVTDTASAELFDPALGVFSVTGSLKQARAHHTATLLPNGMVLVLGGTQVMPPGGGGAPPAPVSIDSVEVYDPGKGTFQNAGKLLMARDSHSATLLANGTVLVTGGYTHGFDGDADPTYITIFNSELFDPATSVSTRAASLERDRAEHVATLLNNGQVLVSGGISGYLELCCSPKPYTVMLPGAELYK